MAVQVHALLADVAFQHDCIAIVTLSAGHVVVFFWAVSSGISICVEELPFVLPEEVFFSISFPPRRESLFPLRRARLVRLCLHRCRGARLGGNCVGREFPLGTGRGAVAS